jgi:DNA adenine methylase
MSAEKTKIDEKTSDTLHNTDLDQALDSKSSNNDDFDLSLLQKPFIKWVGGKTQLIQIIMNNFPSEMNNYHELFVGGGSVLLAALTLQKNGYLNIKGKVYAYDKNKNLVNVYQQIQKKYITLHKALNKYFSTYNSIEDNEVIRDPENEDESLTSKESYYYWLRKQYNTSNLFDANKAAMFIFLNKTCFRGLYREGPNGFNVPYGHYKKVQCIDKEEIKRISQLIRDVQFICCDYKQSIKKPVTGDFVYLDPPYAPENSKSFVGYTKDGFSLDEHRDLFKKVKAFEKSKIKFLMSNANVPLVVDSFIDFYQEEIEARRSINSKNPESTTTELLIFNYVD